MTVTFRFPCPDCGRDATWVETEGCRALEWHVVIEIDCDCDER